MRRCFEHRTYNPYRTHRNGQKGRVGPIGYAAQGFCFVWIENAFVGSSVVSNNATAAGNGKVHRATSEGVALHPWRDLGSPQSGPDPQRRPLLSGIVAFDPLTTLDGTPKVFHPTVRAKWAACERSLLRFRVRTRRFQTKAVVTVGRGVFRCPEGQTLRHKEASIGHVGTN